MNQKSGQSGTRGFTLVELLIAMAVAAIFLVLAVPSFITILQQNRVNVAADQLYISLAEARREALKRQANVCVCPADTTCLRDDTPACTCRNDGDWGDGWIIFERPTSSVCNTISPSSTEIIKVVPYTSLHTDVNFGPDTAVDDWVEFGATGGTIDGNPSPTTGTFNVCYTGLSTNWRRISISASGRIEDRVCDTGCGTCP